ncbi:MAG: SRPBCC family protein [Deltaproteobacteria bacterium]|nr:SRPBCC family protein [Deltaproteobacteria bacterium]MBI3386261.1 SRPBCC family protein [Deltaproteobacteria bacterium]
MSQHGAHEYTTEVAASVKDCFATIIDFERYPSWSSSVREIRVLDRHPDGLAHRVEFHVDITLKTIRYVLEYEYDPPGRLTWRSVDGDVESIEGKYTFEKLAANKTRVTCRQVVVIGFWLPGLVRRAMERTALQQSVDEFKQAAEARIATAKKKPAKKRG